MTLLYVAKQSTSKFKENRNFELISGRQIEIGEQNDI